MMNNAGVASGEKRKNTSLNKTKKKNWVTGFFTVMLLCHSEKRKEKVDRGINNDLRVEI